MKILSMLLNALEPVLSNRNATQLLGNIYNAINYGRTRNDGGHDHRYNRGKDRTQAQREADMGRRK